MNDGQHKEWSILVYNVEHGWSENVILSKTVLPWLSAVPTLTVIGAIWSPVWCHPFICVVLLQLILANVVLCFPWWFNFIRRASTLAYFISFLFFFLLNPLTLGDGTIMSQTLLMSVYPVTSVLQVALWVLTLVDLATKKTYLFFENMPEVCV